MIRKTTALLLALNLISMQAYGFLAGGRPNSISGGQNAFAGVVNPANAVWIEDRLDIGYFVVHQKSTLDNKDNNPLFPQGKINLTYKTEFFSTADAAVHKQIKIKGNQCSISLAAYSTPGIVKLRTKEPFPISGTTPIRVVSKTQVVSSIFSYKLNEKHSLGLSLDYFYLSHRRDGFQNTDNRLKSVSPGHVTNNGMDHSSGLGFSFGWRWNISNTLTFGCVYIRKSNVGQFRRYRGFEPYHAKNYIPQTIGGGFTYRFNKKIAGRLEVIWTNYGNLPNANNAVLSNGKVNTYKRGSNKSPGAGLQDATFINLGIGYKMNASLSLGAGFSHRIKLARKSRYIIAHSYIRQTTYNLITFGVNYKCRNNEFYLIVSHGIPTRDSGVMPKQIGEGKFVAKRYYDTLSLAWGYLY